MGLIGDILSGNKAQNAATHAANTQSDAALQAQKLEQQKSDAALQTQNQVWQGTQANQQPFLQAGQSSVNNLANLVNNPATSQYGQTFSAPTLEEARATPGYEFQLEQGTNALDKSAAATGNLYSGTQGTALQKFGQGLADTTYNDRYNQALQTYNENYNVWNTDTSNQINRLQNLSSLGSSTATNLGQEGQNFASGAGNINMTTGLEQAQQINNAAAARASGYVGKANAYGSEASNINNTLQDALFLGMQAGG